MVELAVAPGGEFDAGQEGQAAAGHELGGTGQAGQGIVVGDGKEADAGALLLGDELVRSPLAVGGDGVQV